MAQNPNETPIAEPKRAMLLSSSSSGVQVTQIEHHHALVRHRASPGLLTPLQRSQTTAVGLCSLRTRLRLFTVTFRHSRVSKSELHRPSAVSRAHKWTSRQLPQSAIHPGVSLRSFTPRSPQSLFARGICSSFTPRPRFARPSPRSTQYVTHRRPGQEDVRASCGSGDAEAVRRAH